ncbi:hypothetical protein CCACVL1_23812, partial [Corchorus capsularis]
LINININGRKLIKEDFGQHFATPPPLCSTASDV